MLHGFTSFEMRRCSSDIDRARPGTVIEISLPVFHLDAENLYPETLDFCICKRYYSDHRPGPRVDGLRVAIDKFR